MCWYCELPTGAIPTQMLLGSVFDYPHLKLSGNYVVPVTGGFLDLYCISWTSKWYGNPSC
ncbi:MAG: hypothetical protein IPO02_10235 [Bacteroidetes bacterium]|nr:hypothetical protein [Bacteroidota bacterium]